MTNNKCLVDTFDRNFQFDVEHVSIAKQADLVLIAPASANVIGKIANGIADDMLTTTIMACTCTKLVSPAMNTNMYNNPIVQDNIKKLENYGYVMIEPECGRLACGDVGAGKLPSEEVLVESIEKHLCQEQDMAGLNVLVTAGPTVEAIDPVRFISNHSSGKMGYAIANDAARRGANVTLISGPVSVRALPQVKVIDVVSAKDMFEAVKDNFKTQDIVVKAAAVADYTPVVVADNKIKKSDEDMCIKVKRTEDILKYVSENRTENQYICGFSMETENLFENSRAKLEKKKLDMIAANSLKVEGAGFGVDTNVITLITKDDMIKLPLMSKAEVAGEILSQILKNREAK